MRARDDRRLLDRRGARSVYYMIKVLLAIRLGLLRARPDAPVEAELEPVPQIAAV